MALSGQEPVGDVAVGQRRRRDQRLVGDGHPVVRLVAVAQALEHLDRVGDRRLGDLDRLEPALEGGVLLEVLAVLVERGRTDGLQLAAGQHRLEDAGGVDRALGRAGADEGVDLVDEQHDVAAGADLLEHLLEALLEVTAVARAGHQGAEVERVDLLVLERLGDVALDDVLGQALDDRRLADAGLADEDRVVLRPPREDLHDPLDLLLAADDRVELALAGVLGQVAAELVEHQRRGRRVPATGRRGGRGRRLLALEAGEQLDDLLADPVEVRAELLQHLGGDALALADQAEQDVLGADVGVAELQRLAQGQLEHLLGARGERDVAAGRLLALADDLLDLGAHGLQGDVEALQRLGGDALALVDEAEQDVLGADVVVGEHAGLFLGQHDHPAGTVGEPLEHAYLLEARSGVRGLNPSASLRVPGRRFSQSAHSEHAVRRAGAWYSHRSVITKSTRSGRCVATSRRQVGRREPQLVDAVRVLDRRPEGRAPQRGEGAARRVPQGEEGEAGRLGGGVVRPQRGRQSVSVTWSGRLAIGAPSGRCVDRRRGVLGGVERDGAGRWPSGTP